MLVSGASSGAAELDRPEIPVFFPVTRESAARDGFAGDSLLQRGVGCELGVTRITRLNHK